MQGNATPDNPNEYDFVERYQSNLPLDRVKELRRRTQPHLDATKKIDFDNLTEEQVVIEMLAGFIIELTQLNKNQQ